MKVMLLVVGLVLTALSPAAAAEWQIAQWDQTVHYRLTFNAAEATQAALRLTAVNEYEVFLNGDSVGSDGDWTTVEELAVELQGGANHLAVRVENWGQGNGSGLLVEVVAGDQAWLSTTSGLQEVWRWSGDPQQGTDWLTADVSEIAGWTTVQRGWLERPRLSGWDDTLGAEVIAGYPGGVDVGGDGLSLRTVEGENLALSQSANRPEVFDGQAESVWTIEPDELNSFARVDLGIQRLLGEVRVFTAGENAEDFAATPLQGYAVEVSNDGFQWREVGAIRGIADFVQTAVAFEPIFGRFLRVVATELDPLRRARVADIQVTGQGVAPAGTFTSAPLELGLPGQRKIYDRFRWTGQRPAGTALSMQFRTSNDGVSWSDWSLETNASEADLQVPEPRDLLQYRVNFSTDFEDIGPRLDSLIIAFAEQTPTSAARVRVEPNRGVVGRETEFIYHLAVEFDEGDLGVERIRIDMPSLAEVTEIVPPSGMEVVRTTVSGDALELVWADLWRQSGQLQLRFRARLLTNQFAFSTRLFSPEAAISLDAEEDDASDPETGAPYSYSVRAFDAVGPILDQVRTNPPVFTPNGDNINDHTIIEFVLSRISVAQEIDVDIFDLGGRLVRQLDTGALRGGQYVRPPAGGNPARSPGFWDGRDDDGTLVVPGLYLVRVRAQLDQGDKTALCSVAVVY